MSYLLWTDTPKVLESKYQAGFGVIILGQNPQTFMIPILYRATILYDSTTILYDNSESFE